MDFATARTLVPAAAVLVSCVGVGQGVSALEHFVVEVAVLFVDLFVGVVVFAAAVPDYFVAVLVVARLVGPAVALPAGLAAVTPFAAALEPLVPDGAASFLEHVVGIVEFLGFVVVPLVAAAVDLVAAVADLFSFVLEHFSAALAVELVDPSAAAAGFAAPVLEHCAAALVASAVELADCVVVLVARLAVELVDCVAVPAALVVSVPAQRAVVLAEPAAPGRDHYLALVPDPGATAHRPAGKSSMSQANSVRCRSLLISSSQRS